MTDDAPKYFQSVDDGMAVIRAHSGCTMDDLHQLGYRGVAGWLVCMCEVGFIFRIGHSSFSYRYFPND